MSAIDETQFRAIKNNKQITQTIFINTVKMLTTRGGILRIEDFQQNLDSIQGTLSESKAVLNGIDNKPYAILYVPQEVKSLKKVPGIKSFIDENTTAHIIIIVKKITKKPVEKIFQMHSSTEIFEENALMINLIEHELVPQHIPIRDKDEIQRIYDTYHGSKKMFPKIPVDDPVVRYYNCKIDDLMYIITSSETSGFKPMYRVVTPGRLVP